MIKVNSSLPISEKTKQVLREVGLNTYEIDVYAAVLDSGQLTAMEISEKSKVPYSKIYEVLKTLKDKGWIKTIETRPAKYYPASPVEALAATEAKIEDKIANWKQTVTSELQPLFEKREIIERPDILILHGVQSVTSKLEETLKRATKEIMIAAPEFAKKMLSSAPLSLDVLKKTNAEIKIMVTGKAEEWKSLKRLTGFVELRVRNDMFGGGIIVDGKEAMLFLGEEKPSLVIWSNHAGLVRFAREYFQFLWDSSKKVVD